MQDDVMLAKWLAGELTNDELKAFEATPEYPEYVRIKEVSAKLAAPAFDGNAMYRKVIGSKRNKVIPLYSRMWFKVAAAVIILFGLGMFLRSMLPTAQSAGLGEQLAFTLPDQSEVILNAGSEITYKKHNWDDNRRLELDGEAFFKVAKGKTFEVVTGLGNVEVLGTQFNVRSREGRFDVICFEGRVRVISAGTENIITKGQSISFADGKPIDVPSANGSQPGWLSGELNFNNENLARIVAELTRQYKIEISVDAGSQTQLFTGTLPMNNLDEALVIICATYHLIVEKSGDRIVLKPVNARG